MWCNIQKNGTAVYRARYKNPLTGKLEIASVSMPRDSVQTRNKAQRELTAKIEAAIAELQCVDCSTTLSQLQKEYLKTQALTLKQSTVKRNEIITSSVLDLLNPDAIVNNLTAQYVNSRLLDSGKPVSTVNNYITRFKAMLNWGYANDYHNNLALISKLKPFVDSCEEQEITLKYLEPTEAKDLLAAIKEDNSWNWYYITSILLLTGLRFGELSALEVSDIDMSNLTIRISKTYDSINDIVTTPKTDNSKRTIHIQPDLLTELKKCMLWRNEMMIERNIRTKLLIPNIKTGDHILHRSYEKYLGDISEKLLGRHVTPHMLRHTHASLLAANGMTPDEIARRLGHSKSTITSKIYIHVTQKVIENDNKKIDQIKLFS
jgi:integrase